MRNSLPFLAALLLVIPAAHAQNWSVGIGTGPFVFGRFVERTSTVGTEQGTTTITSRLSAATRPGVDADIERDFGRWLGIRVGAAWTYAPLRIKSGSGSTGATIDAGHIGVTTFVVPLVLNLNRGAFRFHVMGGPAYALYHGNARAGGRGRGVVVEQTLRRGGRSLRHRDGVAVPRRGHRRDRQGRQDPPPAERAHDGRHPLPLLASPHIPLE